MAFGRMADMPSASDPTYQQFFSGGRPAVVPQEYLGDFDHLLVNFVGDEMFADPHHGKAAAGVPYVKSAVPAPIGDPVMSIKSDPENLFGDHPRLEQETAYQNNFWLTPHATSSRHPAMAFQPVSMPSQLPPVGAEYQIQSGMEPITSPYSPESEGSFDDGDGPHFQIPAELELAGGKGLLQLTEEQLVSLSARDLNRLCRDLPEDVVKQLKKRRRTLKNRGYAYNSRVRRVSQKNQLEKERDELKKQISQLQERLKGMEREATHWKSRAQALERGDL